MQDLYGLSLYKQQLANELMLKLSYVKKYLNKSILMKELQKCIA